MEWKTVKLGEVCDLIKNREKGVLIDKSNYVSTENMLPNKGGVAPSSITPYDGAIIYHPKDVLISNIRPYFKKIWFADKIGGCSGDVLCFRSNSKIDSTYLYYLLSQDSFFDYVMAGSKGTKMPRGDKGQIMQYEFSLPPLDTQRRIAAILSSLDDKIENNNRINRNLEAQAQALFKSWFVDFEPFGGTMPEDWREGTLGDIIEIKYGKDHKKLSDGEIPVYGSGGLMRHAEKALYTGESVLIPRKGTLNNVMYVNEAFWTVDTMFYSIPKQDHVMLYAYLYLSNINLSSLNAGSAVPSMTTEILNKMKLVIPDVHTLIMFDNKVSTLYSAYKCNRHENQRLATLRDTLLPKLMKGEIAL